MPISSVPVRVNMTLCFSARLAPVVPPRDTEEHVSNVRFQMPLVCSQLSGGKGTPQMFRGLSSSIPQCSGFLESI
jgi:hypothetical protein